MAFASLQDYIDRAILHAQVATKLGENPLIQQDMEVETIAANALHAFATTIAKDLERRHLLQKTTSVALTNGKGTLDSTLLTEFLDDASVRDGDTAANNEKGNLLVRVHQYNDFLGYLPSSLGYFCLHDNEIHTRAIGSGSLLDTASPLTVECSYVPDPTEVPVEIEDDAVEVLSKMIQKVYVENA